MAFALWKGGRLEAFHVPFKTLKAVLDLEMLSQKLFQEPSL
jgi:hypothetical protein